MEENGGGGVNPDNPAAYRHPAWLGPATGRGYDAEHRVPVGLGVSSFFLTIPYGLTKVVYATLGGIIGGFTYALTGGNDRAAKAVWDSSLRGTYVITPDHLKGDKAVRFLGVPGESDGAAAAETVPAMPGPARK